jgi:Nuclease-related domain
VRYDSRCVNCGVEVASGLIAYWDAELKQLSCVACGESPSTAGGSARREFERRARNDERRMREAHPRLGGFLVAIREERPSTRAWSTGARGEEAIGARLDALGSHGVVAIHDRRIPGTKANIDHLAIGASGVYVIDAKAYKGRIELRDIGGWLRRDERLFVSGRDRTKFTDGLLPQVIAVQRALTGGSSVPVHPVLCFVNGDWSLFARPFEIRGVAVLWPKALPKLLTQSGALTAGDIEDIARRLRSELPPR